MENFSQIPLEDRYEDILSKARRGLGLEPEKLAAEAGISTTLASSVMGGTFHEVGLRALANVLGLHEDRLVAIAKEEYTPSEIPSLPGVARFNTVFDDMTVNSYLVWDPDTQCAAAFDTGTDCQECLDVLKRHELTLEQIFLTHTHGDHVYDLDRLKEKTGAKAWGPESEALEGVSPFASGQPFSIGKLNVETRSTWGHSAGGITYYITGLSRPIAIVGDAIFAGSMGGGGVSYEAALKTNREQILSLPDDTVLCPGHGPLTTVGDEKRHNPFFA